MAKSHVEDKVVNYMIKKRISRASEVRMAQAANGQNRASGQNY